MRNFLFWSLTPLTLPQALYVRRTALRFPPPDCEPRGAVGEGEVLRLVGIGDSIIAGVGASKLEFALVAQSARALADRLDRRVHWTALGRSGARAEHVLADYVPRLPPVPADVFVVSVGVNDVTGLTPLRAWRRQLAEILARLRDHSPDAVIGLAGLPPLSRFPLLPEPLRFAAGQRARAFDTAARRIAQAHSGVVHLPIEAGAAGLGFCGDGFHPSEASYAWFGRAMAERLTEGPDPSRERAS